MGHGIYQISVPAYLEPHMDAFLHFELAEEYLMLISETSPPERFVV
jgi:hypothetical protein